MKIRTVLRGLGIVAWMLVLGSCVVWFAYRPWVLRWGATDAEIARAMPGDSIISDATFSATRAVTVNADAEFIWPWLLQLGYGRAGLYSYDRLDNAGIPSAEFIIPEYQSLSVGDSVPIGPGFFVNVTVLEENRMMLLVFPDWAEATWAWGLYPEGPGKTRLVTRLRGRPRGMTRIVVDLGEIFPMRKSMLGIKRRAETLARQRSQASDSVLFRTSPFGFSLRTKALLRRLREAIARPSAESVEGARRGASYAGRHLEPAQPG
jgi:hypothetical protein